MLWMLGERRVEYIASGSERITLGGLQVKIFHQVHSEGKKTLQC